MGITFPCLHFGLGHETTQQVCSSIMSLEVSPYVKTSRLSDGHQGKGTLWLECHTLGLPVTLMNKGWRKMSCQCLIIVEQGVGGRNI